MKVKHIVKSTQEDIDCLFDIVLPVCMASYTSIEEQTAAIYAAKDVLKTKLDELIYEAYKIGRKLAKVESKTSTPPLM